MQNHFYESCYGCLLYSKTEDSNSQKSNEAENITDNNKPSEAEYDTTLKTNESDKNEKKSDQQGNCYW